MRPRPSTVITIAAVLCVVAYWSHTTYGGSDAAPLPTSGMVVSVYDGDTITIEANGKRYKCRLAGIDTPEKSYTRTINELDKISKYASIEGRRELADAVKPYRKWAKIVEGYAALATDSLRGLIADKTVRLTYDSKSNKKDRFGRLLVYISEGDRDICAEMVRLGWAVADTRFDVDRSEEYIRLWRKAQGNRVGMWRRF